MKGEYDKAIADFSEAIRLDSKSARAYFGRAEAHLRNGSPEMAIADCNESIRLDPNYPHTYLTRGMAYQQKGDEESATRDFLNGNWLLNNTSMAP